MLLKQFIYNDYNLELYSTGEIFFHPNNFFASDFVDIADVPILNELQKDLLEYYIEWKRNNINSIIENLGKIYGGI